MFKKFSLDDFHGSTQIKSSVQRAIRSKIAEQFPQLCSNHQHREKKPSSDSDSDASSSSSESDSDDDEQPTPLDLLMPKKNAEIRVGKLENKVTVVLVENEPLFFQVVKDGPYYPTLKVLHRFPTIMKRLRTDKGAIKFVFKGSNIMCPGLTSEGATMHDEVEEDEPVAIFAEGKEHALAVGTCVMSTEAMRTENKGIGVELCHHLGDGLWEYLSKVHE
jgi:predicted RNA-binding protein (TIGR00451 family)